MPPYPKDACGNHNIEYSGHYVGAIASPHGELVRTGLEAPDDVFDKKNMMYV